jgi:hypothetical protein
MENELYFEIPKKCLYRVRRKERPKLSAFTYENNV